MRIRLLVTLALSAVLLAGGTCLPLVDNTKREPITGRVLGIVLMQPLADRTVPQGTSVLIDWSAGNLTGQPATITLAVESHTDLTVTILEEGIPLEGTGGTDTLAWNTEDFSGPYRVLATITTDSLTNENPSMGLITVDLRPTFEFTAPTGDVTFHPATDSPLDIKWFGGDESATVQIGLDPDTDHTNGNETVILEQELPVDPAAGSLAWDGNDNDGTQVAADTYNLFASATDGVNAVVIVDGLGQITVVR
jgi:hypothetical protein